MKTVTKPYANAFITFAKDKPEVLCLSADLTSSCEVDQFRAQFPERFFSMGMTEQNMLSLSGGLAMEGYRPFIHTFSVFLYRRPYDQLVNSVVYSNRKVRLMGFLPGITTPGGITHQAIEDIAVLRSLPNMTILETGDATEVETVLDIADGINGPVYVRILRGIVPRLFNTPFQFNQLRVLSQGSDLMVVSSGITTEEVIRANNVLKQNGIHITHVHVSTLKPFAKTQFLELLAQVNGHIITIENHTVIGGLGSIVAEIIAEEGIGKKLIRLGLQDTFAHGASREYLMKKYKLDATALIATVETLLHIKLQVTEEALKTVNLESENNTKVEDL